MFSYALCLLYFLRSATTIMKRTQYTNSYNLDEDGDGDELQPKMTRISEDYIGDAHRAHVVRRVQEHAQPARQRRRLPLGRLCAAQRAAHGAEGQGQAQAAHQELLDLEAVGGADKS